MLKKFRIRLFTIISLLWFACQLLIGCQPIKPQPLPALEFKGGNELVFETIELPDPSVPNSLGEPSTIDKWPNHWSDKEPGIIIITSSQEITRVSPYITNNALATLEKLDFSQFFALIAFNGWKSSLYSNFNIQKIIKNEDQVYVFAQPGQEGPQLTVSSLYHLIRIKKNGEWRQTCTFHLYFDNKESNAPQVSLYIP